MKFSVALLGLFSIGLTACGGGGSDGAGAVSSSDLEGAWIQTVENYTDQGGSSFEWTKTVRTTIIVDKISDSTYTFTNCITGESSSATVEDGEVNFAVSQLPSLEVRSNSQLYTFIDCSLGGPGCSTIYTADVTLNKVSNSTSPNLADVNITNPVNVSDWDEVCIHTVEDLYLNDTIQVVSEDRANDVVLDITLYSADKLTTGSYSFPPNNIGFDIDVYMLQAGILYYLPFDGVGDLTVTEGSSLSVNASLLMNGTDFDGTISLDAF